MNPTITLAATIRVTGLPQNLIDEIVEENRFENPAYLSNEQNGRSNWDTPRYIETIKFEDNSLVLPRGYFSRLLWLLQRENIEYERDDQRFTFPISFINHLYGVELRPYQETCVESAIHREQGIIVAPTGSGKSLIGLEILRKRGQKSLIIVHRSDLAKQWISLIKERLGIDAGLIGSGEWKIGDEITVALIQTLASREKELPELPFGLVLVDECHHVPAQSFFQVLSLIDARFRYGLSATPTRADGLEKLIFYGIGPAIEKIDRVEVEEIGATVPAQVKLVSTGFSPSACFSWMDYASELCGNPDRNLLLLDLITQQNRPTLVLVDRVGHAENLSEMLQRRGIEHVLAHGKVNREGLLERIRNASLTIGTSNLLGEGLDVSGWEVLILGSPISSETKLLQAIGRVVRAAPDKKEATIYDLRDDCGFAGASFKKRFEIYKKNKIWVDFGKEQAA